MQEPQVTRPQSSHRLSMGSTPTLNMPARHSSSRHHAHSVSLGATNPSHRITRRKSMNASAVNNAAAVAAAFQEDTPGVAKRRSFNLKSMGSSRGYESSKHVGSHNDQYPPSATSRNDVDVVGNGESAVADDIMPAESIGSVSKIKARRASEGSHLVKGEGKRSSGELRCEKCGKGYKHSSCLTKHLSVFSGSFVFQLSALPLPPFSTHSPFLSTLPVFPNRILHL